MIHRFFFLLFFLLLVPSVFGFGLAYNAGSLSFVYKQNSVAEANLYVFSKDGDSSATLSVSGAMAKYAVYDKNIPLTSTYTPFLVRFVFPAHAEKPGVYTTDIHVTRTKVNGDGSLSYLVGAQVPLQIRVLYPDAFLEFNEFSIQSPHVKLGEKVTFLTSGVNFGETAIKKLRSIVSIFYNGELLDTIQTEERSLKSEDSLQVQTSWETKKRKIGAYKAIAKIAYDGKETSTKEITFYIGDEEIAVQNYTRQVTNYSVNKFSLDVMSKWNVPIAFSAGISFIRDRKEVAWFKTPTYTLDPWIPKMVDGFVDTNGFALGRYDVNITLFAGQKSNIFQGSVDVIEGKPNVVIRWVEKEAPAFASKQMFILIVSFVVLLLILNIMMFSVYYKKRRR